VTLKGPWLGGALLSDQEIEDRLEHTRSLLALTPACAQP
jgi:hypothetical protein